MKNKKLQRDLDFHIQYSDLSTFQLAEKFGIPEQEVEKEIHKERRLK